MHFIILSNKRVDSGMKNLVDDYVLYDEMFVPVNKKKQQWPLLVYAMNRVPFFPSFFNPSAKRLPKKGFVHLSVTPPFERSIKIINDNK